MSNLITENVSDFTFKDNTASKENKEKKKHKKKRRNRKKSDPTITNISVLLSSSLSLVSPEKRARKPDKNVLLSNESCRNYIDRISIENKDSVQDTIDLSDTEAVTVKSWGKKSKIKDKGAKIDSNNVIDLINTDILTVDIPAVENVNIVENATNDKKIERQSKNAFEFMMESRHKSIGRNSPGKDIEKVENSPSTENKKKIAARKLLMEQWATAKSSKKRKVDEKEREVYIQHYLEKRAKRMKKMLSIQDSKSKQKHKKIINVVSDSEDSQDTLINEASNSIKENHEKNDNIKVRNNSQHQGLDKFLGIPPNGQQEKRKRIEEDVCESDENTNRENMIKIKMFSPKFFKRKNKIDRDTSHVNNDILVEKVRDKDKREKENRKDSERHKKKKTKKQDVAHEEESNLLPHGEVPKLQRKRVKRRLSEISQSLNISDESSNDSICIIKNDNEVTCASLRRSSRTRKPRENFSTYIVTYAGSDSEKSDDTKKQNKNKLKNGNTVKLAPIFLQNKVKPKIDPLVLEARRNFLMSGIPEALKKTVEKQQSIDIEPNFFPEISHIQQKSTAISKNVDYWNLPKADIHTVDFNISLPEMQILTRGSLNNYYDNQSKEFPLCPPEKIKNLKSILLEIKKNNPDYPVFRSFRLLKKKADNLKIEQVPEKPKTTVKKKRGRKSNKAPESEMTMMSEKIDCNNSSMMWTEKYKGDKYEDLIGNYNGTLELKKWLQGWLEINENKSRIVTRRDSSSSDFDYGSESCDSTTYPQNTIIINGPLGSGKTMAVYAICNDLGVNVLELNASSKRTGKRLLLELQEATQSHQVRKNGTVDLSNYFKSKNKKKHEKSTTNESQNNKKMCLLLVEDIDVVFEHDEGFLSGLSQLIATSKRPIVLIATDISSPSLQKIISQNTVIQFSALSPKSMSVWLQILCLLEGCFVDKDSLSELLQWNNGDVRKTLLELQFWIESGGGNVTKTSLKISRDIKSNAEDDLAVDDCQLVIEESSSDSCDTISIHSNCITNFLDENITLDKLWWNLPNFSILPPIAQLRKSKVSTNSETDEVERTEILKLLDCFECFSLIDRCYAKSGIVENNNLSVRNSRLQLKDSIELNEICDSFDARENFTREWGQSLSSGYIKICKKSENVVLNMGLPHLDEIRRRSKQNGCKTKYMEIPPISCYTDRNSFNLDYFPILRTITRSEEARSANNNKRRNRFFNYFRNLGFHCSDSVSKVACSILNSTSSDNKKVV